MDNVVSDKQKASFVAWEEVLAARDSLPENTPERLLLEMYTRVPPKRNDYSHMYVYKDTSAKTRKVTTDAGETVCRGTFAPSEAQKKAFPNYIILDEPAIGTASDITLYLQQFKTAKPGQVYIQHLPTKLCAAIRSSLKKNPRELLFTKPDGTAYKHANSFCDWVSRALQEIFQKKVTINTLRHSFISGLKMDSMTARELTNTARHLQHSLQTLTTYRLGIPTGKA
jgi:hypothetical protein